MKPPVTNILLICLALTVCWLTPARAQADPISGCNPSITVCDLYEGSLLDIGNVCCFIAGDWILLDPLDGTVSDVLRFFNNIVNTGGGTGLGTQALLYSDDQGNLPTTFSVNAVRIFEGSPDPLGETLTQFTSEGTLYRVHSQEGPAAVPEPATFGLLALGLAAVRRLRRRPSIT